MRRVPNTGVASRWESHRWELADVIPLQAKLNGLSQPSSSEPQAQLVLDTPTEQRWAFSPFEVRLYKDDGDGYHLNVSSPHPCWFVMWRMESGDEIPSPQAVSLSYHDAGRWLDSQERCDQVPLLPSQPEVLDTLREFAAVHHVQEEKRRKRPDSFKPLTDRFGMPAAVSTGKTYGAQQHGR
jgi:hypothetical protein